MPAITDRAAIVELLEDRFGREPSAYLSAYDDALQKLEERDIVDLAADAVDEDAVEHFRGDWLGGGWWDADLPIGDTLRAGLIEALRTARDAELPLGTIWVPGASDGFETQVVKGAHQVTLVLLTSRPQGQATTAS